MWLDPSQSPRDAGMIDAKGGNVLSVAGPEIPIDISSLAGPTTPDWKDSLVFSALLGALLTFENCCLAEQINFWQPLPGLWRRTIAVNVLSLAGPGERTLLG